jgi:Mn2+/Fe2+ NRAMP family transporter
MTCSYLIGELLAGLDNAVNGVMVLMLLLLPLPLLLILLLGALKMIVIKYRYRYSSNIVKLFVVSLGQGNSFTKT